LYCADLKCERRGVGFVLQPRREQQEECNMVTTINRRAVIVGSAAVASLPAAAGAASLPAAALPAAGRKLKDLTEAIR
jgi:hypothetical protein